MPLLWSLLALLFFYGVMFSFDQANQHHVLRDAEVVALADNLLIYRNAVAAFADSNPAVLGVVDDLSLDLPQWYVKAPDMAHYLTPGTSYVYTTQSLPGLVGELADKTESINVGTNQGGFLNSPNGSASTTPLPAQIPPAAVVLIQ